MSVASRTCTRECTLRSNVTLLCVRVQLELEKLAGTTLTRYLIRIGLPFRTPYRGQRNIPPPAESATPTILSDKMISSYSITIWDAMNVYRSLHLRPRCICHASEYLCILSVQCFSLAYRASHLILPVTCCIPSRTTSQDQGLCKNSGQPNRLLEKYCCP